MAATIVSNETYWRERKQ